MDYNVISEENSIRVKDIKDFIPKHIFECGQCFRWNEEEDGSYTGVAFGKVINVKLEKRDLIINNTNKEDFNNIWYQYFDLGRDYTIEKERISKIDDILKESVEFGNGIRILKQEPWEMLISFIISARNSIPNIKKTIEKISAAFGEKIGEYNEKEYFAFPKADVLAKLEEDDLRPYGTSFRTKYILSSANKIVEEGNIDYLKDVETKDAREKLQEFSGVGPKVSDCVLLFGLSKMDVFPVDVWVQRVMDEFYTKGKHKNLEKIREFGINMFGDVAGIGQQYLFYYAREKGIGKKTK